MAAIAETAVPMLSGLQEEIAGYRRLLGLLQTEQEALSSGNADALSPIAAAKLTEVENLAELARARDLRIEHSPDGGEAIAAWAELRSLAAAARRQNELNGRIIALRRQHFDRAASALWQAAGVISLYGADGRPQGTVPARTFAAI